MTICGTSGVCDDGIKGTGKCFCKDNTLDPVHYCEYVKDLHKAHEEEQDM